MRPRVRSVSPLFHATSHEALLLEPKPGLDALTASAIGSKSPWARLRALLALEARELLALAVYAVALGGLSLAVPVAVQVLVNTVAFGTLMQPLLVLSVLLLGVLGIAATVRVMQWYAVELLHRRIFVRVAEDFARRLPAMPSAVHERIDVRELSNRFFDVVTVQKVMSQLLLDGFGLLLQTLVGMLLLAFYHPLLLLFDVLLVVAIAGVVVLGRGAVRTAVSESSAKYRVAAWLQELASKPDEFSGAAGAVRAAQVGDELTRGYLARRKDHYRHVWRQLVGGAALQVFAMTALLGLGGWLVIERELTIGQLVAAELVVGAVALGLAKLGKQFEAVYDLLGALDKVGRVLDAPADLGGSRATNGEAA
jgi:ABC-type bacteriocin/lantibiotic exporter with double-glycine peptidase domain